MRVHLILLLLQLGQNVEVSFSQNVCSNLPAVPHAIVSGETKRVTYQEGHAIEFTCEPGYKSSQTPKYVCTSNGWLTVRQGTCFYGACAVPVMHQYLRAAQLQAATERVKVGHRLQFECDNGYILEGSEHTECLETGQWSAPFPTCAETCTATGISEGVYISQNTRTVRIGQHLRFYCAIYHHFLRGEGKVECLADGKWSHPFPTCGVDPTGCTKPPPALENGNTVESVRPEYSPYEKVYYSCHNLHTMLGDGYMECVNNEWRGLLECTKPCVVDSETMRRNNVVLRYSSSNKVYARHGERISFICVDGTRRSTLLSMNPICFHGSVYVPACE